MAAPQEQRIAVPIDDPNADTEWYEFAKPTHPSNTRHSSRANSSQKGMTFYASMELSQKNLLVLHR